jgi:hypothetical protein
MTPSTKPVTRITSAFVRDRGLRPIIVTITGSLIELRAQGLRQREYLDVGSLYPMAVKQRIMREKQAKKEAKKKGKSANPSMDIVLAADRRARKENSRSAK